MKRLYTYLFLSLLVHMSALAQDASFVWAKQIVNSNIQNDRNVVKIDTDNNIIFARVFNGAADFDSGPGTKILSSTIMTPDGFVMKMDNDGNLLWVKQFQVSCSSQISIRSFIVDNDIYFFRKLFRNNRF
jgi:hypothetical protein